MSDAIDTSAEAVERLASRVNTVADWRCYGIAATLLALLAERDGANALIDRMHEQDVLAIKQWQAAHPGNDLQWPGQIRLTAWLMGEAAKVQAERDAALTEVKRLREEVASLRLTLGGRTFDASVPEPIGCPVPGACQTVAEIVRLRDIVAVLLSVMPVFPAAARQIVGMEDRYEAAIGAARAALAKEATHDQ